MDDRELRQLLLAADDEAELPPGVEDSLLVLVLARGEPGGAATAPTGSAAQGPAAVGSPLRPRPRRRLVQRPGAMLAAVLGLLAAVLAVPAWWPADLPAPTIAPVADAPPDMRDGATRPLTSDDRSTVTDFGVPFSMELGEAPDRLALRSTTPDVEVLYQHGDGRFLAFVTLGPDDVASWADRFGGLDGATVSLPFATQVGGVTATAVDAYTPVEVPLYNTALDGAMWSDLSTRGTGPNRRTEGTDAVRIHVLEVAGQRISVLAVAPETEFADWVARTAQVLDTLRWEGPGAGEATTPERGHIDASRFPVPFSYVREVHGIRVSPGEANPGVEVPLRSSDGIVLIITAGPDSLEGWRQLFDGAEADLSEPFTTSVGGVQAVAFDAVVRSGEVWLYTSAREGRLWSDIVLAGPDVRAEKECDCAAGDTARIHVFEVDGRVVTALALTERDTAEAWVTASTDLLATLRWGDDGS